jgi:membrane protein involved in colicin uptake
MNALTGEVTEREFNDKEKAQQDADAIVDAKLAELKAAETKANAKAKSDLLAKLSITEDEARLLLS